ncbi:MAG: hypothetical protein KC448_01220 [Yoonia sp.]|nr:hypothetical protein [Yoonia sp.]
MRGALCNILHNPTDIGKLRREAELHEGLQDAVLDKTIWQRVQNRLADHGGKKIVAG